MITQYMNWFAAAGFQQNIDMTKWCLFPLIFKSVGFVRVLPLLGKEFEVIIRKKRKREILLRNSYWNFLFSTFPFVIFPHGIVSFTMLLPGWLVIFNSRCLLGSMGKFFLRNWILAYFEYTLFFRTTWYLSLAHKSKRAKVFFSSQSNCWQLIRLISSLLLVMLYESMTLPMFLGES